MSDYSGAAFTNVAFCTLLVSELLKHSVANITHYFPRISMNYLYNPETNNRDACFHQDGPALVEATFSVQ